MVNGETDLVGGFDGGPGEDLKREAGEHYSPTKWTLGDMAYIYMHGTGLSLGNGTGTTECEKDHQFLFRETYTPCHHDAIYPCFGAGHIGDATAPARLKPPQ